jgi:hypothetical protein
MDNGCSGNPVRVEIYLHLDTDDTSIRCYVIKHLLKINPQKRGGDFQQVFVLQ